MLFGSNQVAISFDPLGNGPASSLSSTVLFLTSTHRDFINFPDSNLVEVISFLQRTGDTPGRLGVEIDYSMMRQPEAIRVKLVEKNLCLLQALSLLAEQSKAHFQIEPGKLKLLPNVDSEKKPMNKSTTPDFAEP